MVYIKRWSSPAEVEEPSLAPPQEESLPRENSVAVAILESPGTARAKLSMPQGFEIAITSSSTTIGRTDMARVLGLDELCRISRKQFQVRSTDRQYFIEDMGSANSTSLNGEDIKGKGAVSLKDGDVVEAAGVIKLKFKIMEA
ncbi:MAG: FHA domain-containing protein [Dehalococcoidia bacterium]|nr:FHA domain-containing protein [Dehalococcoidia bacterium]